MGRFKSLSLGWMTIVAGVLGAAAVYGGGFVYAGTLAHPKEFTPVARLAVLAATALVAAGTFRLVKEQRREPSDVRDAWLFSGALSVLSWVVLVRPALGDPDRGFTLFRATFASMDVLLAALLVLLAIPKSGHELRRVRVAGMVHLAATTVFALTSLRGSFSFTSPLVLALLGLYVVLFAMGVRDHLQRRANPEPEPGKPTRAALRSARVAVLSSVPVVTGVAVAIAVAAEPRGSAMGVAGVASVLVTLAAVRLRDLHTADSKLVDSLRDQCDELHDRNSLLAAESERALASLREAAEFLSDMTERVAAPLNGVLESGDELREATASAPDIAPSVDKLVRSSDTLLYIVNDLLGISEASAAPLPVTPVAFSPAALLTEVGESFVDAASARGVELVVIGDDGLPDEVVGGRAHVEKVLRIFLDNAVKFSHKGEVALATTFIDTRLDGAVVVRFAVHDAGVGMSREHRHQLLQPVDLDVAPRRYRCKPRGLTLVPGLVALLGGDWGVESEPGRGSTFWFTAPLEPAAKQASVAIEPVAFSEPEREPEPVALSEPEAQPQPLVVEDPEPEPVVISAPEPAPEPEPEPEPETEPQRMQGRLLLAEDNPLNRRVTLVALQNAGFRVEVATNGAEAVDALETGAYDAVLMDCEMPVLDGFEATIEIRSREAGTRRTPIIALTVHSSNDDQLRAAAAGMDDFIAKPFDTRTLLVKLARWVPQKAPTTAN